MTTYDIIADIHGQHALLERLLERLGYGGIAGSRRHPDGRKVVFLGDFVDRGPAVRETLRLARTMVEAGDALAIMGNHEYNAIAFHTPDGSGGFVRPHTPANVGQHSATLAAFEGRPGEWAGYLEWFESLPLFLDLGGVRVVHACWDDAAIADLGGSPRFRRSMLRPPGTPRTPEQHASDRLLKGPEIPLPGGKGYPGSEGQLRTDARVKWWLTPADWRCRDLVLQVPEGVLDGEELPIKHRSRIMGYAADAPPLIFGHYGFPKPAQPLIPNAACIDQGVHRGGGLAAYRWSGETVLDPSNFVIEGATPAKVPPHDEY